MIIGGDASVSFRHELARQAIESSLTAGERLQANRLVVDALLVRPGMESSRLVHHAERSGQVDVLLEHGPTAALESARLGAHRQAAGVLGVLLEHRAYSPRTRSLTCAPDAPTPSTWSTSSKPPWNCAESGVMAAEEAGDASPAR